MIKSLSTCIMKARIPNVRYPRPLRGRSHLSHQKAAREEKQRICTQWTIKTGRADDRIKQYRRAQDARPCGIAYNEN